MVTSSDTPVRGELRMPTGRCHGKRRRSMNGWSATVTVFTGFAAQGRAAGMVYRHLGRHAIPTYGKDLKKSHRRPAYSIGGRTESRKADGDGLSADGCFSLILDEDLKWIYYGSIVSKEAGYAG